MASYLVDGVPYETGDEGIQGALEEAYHQKRRPLCACRPDGGSMYVARVAARFVLKRMPGTGLKHASWCDSYEAPGDLGGLGPLQGAAIQEDPDEGVVNLRLAFPFTRGALRRKGEGTGEPPDSLKGEVSRLSMLSTLHYLWHGGELTKWTPRMQGKRGWGVVRRQLYAAAEVVRAKGEPLVDRLFIPEPFARATAQEIQDRRRAQLSKILRQGDGKSRPLMLVVGELAAIDKPWDRHRLRLHDCMDYGFFLGEDLFRKVGKRFGWELGHFKSPGLHLVVIALFSEDGKGRAAVEELSLMLTDSRWLPLDTDEDMLMLQALGDRERTFERCLRFNLPRTTLTAAAVLHDTQPTSTALFVLRPNVDASALEAMQEGIGRQDDTLAIWTWDTAGAFPELPAKRPMSRAQREVFRPVFLLLDPNRQGSASLVLLGSPRKVQSHAGAPPRLIAPVREQVRSLAPLDVRELIDVGEPAHVWPEADGFLLRRLTRADADRLAAQSERAAVHSFA